MRKKKAVITGALVTGALVLLLAAALFRNYPAAPRRTTIDSFAMGTILSLTAHEGEEEALEQALQRIHQVDALFARTNPRSAISRINRSAGGGSVFVQKEVFGVLSEAVRMAELTDGAFDPTVGAAVSLWGIGTEKTRVPEREELERVSRLIGYRGILLEHSLRVGLPVQGQELDLGGLAKGYAADEAVRVLKEARVRRALVNIGGNVALLGGPWRIGIQHPLRPRGSVLAGMELSDLAVVTSGGYERFFEQDGRRFHHILDPRTASPAESGLHSVTIVADFSALADALSTACFVLGPERGTELLGRAEFRGTEGIFVTENRRVLITKGLEGKLRLLDDDFVLQVMQ
jgi:thiamine biosynthesis lipoprotein